MKIGYIFPAVCGIAGIAGIALLVWFIASGAWMPGA
ncbi:YoaK family small membrane protein [Mixta calida]|nr:YoaK family small membrane protein [Mixta calida]MDU6539283.1 YoaK family small membrane protein [Mixta calida]